jgi:hypothetical protein
MTHTMNTHVHSIDKKLYTFDIILDDLKIFEKNLKLWTACA